MGSEFDFFDFEGSANPVLVQTFRKLGVEDPELLARLVDGHAGFDLDARIFGLEADRRRVRFQLFKAMCKLRELARKITEESDGDRWIDPTELAVADILEGPDWSNVHRAQHYIGLLERIASTPLPDNLKGFAQRPPVDPSVTRIVSAVAHYCSKKGIPFSGEPRASQTSESVTYPIKSEAAKLTFGVLQALGINVPPQTLATHMKTARQVVAVLNAGRAN